MAVTLAGISPSLMANSNRIKGKKKIVFVFRGVAYEDGLNAFKKMNISSEASLHIQQMTCSNISYSHAEGFSKLISGMDQEPAITETQTLDRYTVSDVLNDAFAAVSKKTQVIYLHHTEIGHSSNKLYLEKLDEFFNELAKQFDPVKHRVIVTADIGRNTTTNSCGGRDHSNATCLDAFAIYLGGKASKLSSNTNPMDQKDILKQKF